MYPELSVNLGNLILSFSDALDLATPALAEDRPYRKGMRNERIVSIIKEMAKTKVLDQTIVNHLMENMEEIKASMKEKQEDARSLFEEKFGASEAP